MIILYHQDFVKNNFGSFVAGQFFNR
jgi:hypothetical protein